MVKSVGRLTAAKFNEQPEKARKLAGLSPHWLRHLLASHLDEVGSSGSIIQSILRHESFSTTQHYMHTEEKRRFEEIQKIRINIEPRLVIQKTESNKIALRISLKGGPLGEEVGLIRFISILDDHILKNMVYVRNEKTNDLIEDYKKIRVIRDPLIISYIISSNIDHEILINLKTSIIREAQIRMFDCELEVLSKDEK